MKHILTILFFMVINQVTAQSRYEDGMKNALTLMQKGQFIEAEALFERIGQAEKDNWIPIYQAANVLITQSFITEDKKEVATQLEKAEKLIAEAHRRSENNSEIYTLEGLLYTGYIVMDPGTYGMQYSGKILSLHQKALEINPNNLRAQINITQYQMNQARFFGKDLSQYCQKFEKIIAKFDEEVVNVPFAPSGGKQRAQDLLAQCNE